MAAMRKYKPWLLWALIALVFFWRPMHLDYYPDEGYFAEMTARLMHGELPNTDFANNYLGGLYLYNALWFVLLGKSLLSMRMGMLAMLSLVFVPSVYALCRRLMNTVWAALTTLLVMSMTVSINATVSGNWYAMALSLLALVLYGRGRENPTPLRWFLTGLALGLAFLMKHTVAVYAGFALFAISLIEVLWEQPSQSVPKPKMALLAWGLMILMGVYSLWLFSTHRSLHALVFYIAPLWILIIRIGGRLKAKAHDLLPWYGQWRWMLIGGAVPVLLFLIPYVLRGPQALGALLYEVFVVFPALYLKIAFIDFIPQLQWMDTLLIAWLSSVLVCLYRRAYGFAALALVVGALVLWQTMPPQELINHTMLLAMQLPLMMILLGAWWVWQKLPHYQTLPPETRNVLVLWVFALLLYFNTYPLGTIFYTIYCMVPFVILIGWLGARTVPDASNKPLAVLVGVLLLYCVVYGRLYIERQIDYGAGPMFPQRALTYEIPKPRGGLWVQAAYGQKLAAAVDFIKANSTRTDDVMIYSDLPVLYFLSDHDNPTRYSYEMDSYFSDGTDIIVDIEKHTVRWVLVDPTQKNFGQLKLAQYMQSHYQLNTQLPEGILIFERRN